MTPTGCTIFGAGAHGRVVADILHSRGIPVAAFLDDNPALHGKTVCDCPVAGGREQVLCAPPGQVLQIIVALGNAPLRLGYSLRFREQGHCLVNAVHRSAVVSPWAVFGEGVCICAGTVVNPGAVLGDAVLINTGATVDHDCRIADGAHFSPGVHLSGRVTVGRLAFLGTGVSVAPRVTIGAGAIIGAGAAVVADIPPGVLAAGVPARVIRPLASFDWQELL